MKTEAPRRRGRLGSRRAAGCFWSMGEGAQVNEPAGGKRQPCPSLGLYLRTFAAVQVSLASEAAEGGVTRELPQESRVWRGW